MKTGYKDRNGKEIMVGDIVLYGETKGRNAKIYAVLFDATKDEYALDDVVWNGKSVGGYFRLSHCHQYIEVIGKLCA